MLHGLVPTLQANAGKASKMQGPSKSSSELPSFAMPVQTAPDSSGAGIASTCQRGRGSGLSGDRSKSTPTVTAGEAKKKKAILAKLLMKMKLTEEKLEQLGVLQDDIHGSKQMYLARNFKTRCDFFWLF